MEKLGGSENLAKVVAIASSNSLLSLSEADIYDVFHGISRFNHSCLPNADCFLSDLDRPVELRAVRNIKEGEEITITYIGDDTCRDRDERRAELLDRYSFLCRCTGCEISEAALEVNKQDCANYRSLYTELDLRDAAPHCTPRSGQTPLPSARRPTSSPRGFADPMTTSPRPICLLLSCLPG